MSVSFNTFVGPYVEVYSPEKQSTEEYHSCPNKKCVNHTKPISDGYCSKCGTKIERMERACMEKIDFDCYDEFPDYSLEEVITTYKPTDCEDYIYFVNGNKHAIGIILDGNDVSVNQIDEKTPQAESELFKNKLNKEITRLQEVFGKDNVKIKWGVLVWCS